MIVGICIKELNFVCRKLINKIELRKLAKARCSKYVNFGRKIAQNNVIKMINIDKYIAIEKELSEEYGPFNLFALFLREDSADKWDILVASSWLQQNKQKSMNLIVKKLQEKLSKEELINIPRIALIEDNNPALDAFQRAINMEHGKAEVKDSNFFDLQIKHGYIITSKRTNQNEHAHNKSKRVAARKQADRKG